MQPSARGSQMDTRLDRRRGVSGGAGQRMRTAGSCGCLLLGANRKQPVLDGVTAAVAAAWQLKSCGQSSSKFGRRSAHRLQMWSGYRVVKPRQEGAALALQRQRCASLPGVMLDRARCGWRSGVRFNRFPATRHRFAQAGDGGFGPRLRWTLTRTHGRWRCLCHDSKPSVAVIAAHATDIASRTGASARVREATLLMHAACGRAQLAWRPPAS